MTDVRASAPGKVNVVLHCGPPQGGFHPLVTVFEALSLRETVTVSTSRQRGIRVHTQAFFADGRPDPATSTLINGLDPATNLAVRAAKALQPLAALGPWGDDSASLDIVVEKRVPMAGGMAGGSADAAATLVACNELWGLGLGAEQLEQVGRTLGADVPACLMGGVALGSGRGDHMSLVAAGSDLEPAGSQEAATATGDMPSFRTQDASPQVLTIPTPHWWVLAISDEGLSTPEVFAQLDRRSDPWPSLPGPSALLDALKPALLTGGRAMAAQLHNDLALPALALRPQLAATMESAREAGALGVVLSGSGPTVAALVEDHAHAEEVADIMRRQPHVSQAVIAQGPACGAKLEDHS